jgi:PHD/YefM family antitoxin component YafN of YafNO toxin-antitoxin module
MPTLTIKSDKPMVLIPIEEYDSMRETIDILSDSALMRDIKRGLKDFEEGKTVKLRDLRCQYRKRNGD